MVVAVVEVVDFFRLLCLNCVHNCDDHSLLEYISNSRNDNRRNNTRH